MRGTIERPSKKARRPKPSIRPFRSRMAQPPWRGAGLGASSTKRSRKAHRSPTRRPFFLTRRRRSDCVCLCALRPSGGFLEETLAERRFYLQPAYSMALDDARRSARRMRLLLRCRKSLQPARPRHAVHPVLAGVRPHALRSAICKLAAQYRLATRDVNALSLFDGAGLSGESLAHDIEISQYVSLAGAPSLSTQDLSHPPSGGSKLSLSDSEKRISGRGIVDAAPRPSGLFRYAPTDFRPALGAGVDNIPLATFPDSPAIGEREINSACLCCALPAPPAIPYKIPAPWRRSFRCVRLPPRRAM